MKHIIGITGGIATGKSYVSSYIKKMGYKVIDTDIITHDLYEFNNKGYKEIEKHFKESIVNNKVDRKILGSIIFNDKDRRVLLNSLIHPLVKEEVLKEIEKSNENLIFIDVPLLYESGFDTLCDSIICVYCEKNMEIKRLMLRDNIEENEALKKINSQMDLEIKKDKARYLIESKEDFNETNYNIENILRKIEENTNA